MGNEKADSLAKRGVNNTDATLLKLPIFKVTWDPRSISYLIGRPQLRIKFGHPFLFEYVDVVEDILIVQKDHQYISVEESSQYVRI